MFYGSIKKYKTCLDYFMEPLNSIKHAMILILLDAQT